MQTYTKSLFRISLVLCFILCTKFCSKRKEIVFYDPNTQKLSAKIQDSKDHRGQKVPADYQRQYEALIGANALTDVEESVKLGDYRYVAISGHSYLIPGINEDDWADTIYEKKNVKVIVGTSDMIIVDWPNLQGAAYHYSVEYNKALNTHCRLKNITICLKERIFLPQK